MSNLDLEEDNYGESPENLAFGNSDQKSHLKIGKGPNKKAKMQSARLQYLYPDDDVRGKKNVGVIGQYPYFAPDREYLKKAPKMTKADELYLRKFMAGRANKDVSKIDKTAIADRQLIPTDSEDPSEYDDVVPDGPINVETDLNSRLFLERNRQFKPEQVKWKTPTGDKITLTSQIFGENKYFQQKEDTTEDDQMQAYVVDNWKSRVRDGKPPPSKSARRYEEIKGHTGNVVPFFPKDWKKNANDVFNMILQGKDQPQEDNYDDVTHAAIYKKVPDQHQSLSPSLQKKLQAPIPIPPTGGRPTSGKHYARERQHAKKGDGIGGDGNSNGDPFTSRVAKNYETSKKVEGLLNKLADYMAGEIPEAADMSDIFNKNPKLDPNDTMNGGDDDATTNFTKDDIPKLPHYPELSKEPVYGSPDNGQNKKPTDIDADDYYVNEPETPKVNLDLIPEEDEDHFPNIYTSAKARRNNKNNFSGLIKKSESENLFIYKDFDTTLTKVKTPMKKLPILKQTTSQRGEDLIRDRLLSFNVKNGQVVQGTRRSTSSLNTINERSNALALKRKLEIAQLGSSIQTSKNMQHKAFWVHNSQKQLPSKSVLDSYRTSQDAVLPTPLNHYNSQQNHKLRNTQLRLSLDIQRRVKDGYNPIPIEKDGKLTKIEKPQQDMKLVQQYILHRNRLQPALKYIAPNPMFNRYKLKNSASEKGYEEIVTYPTITGDLKMKNKHVGVNFDDRDIPAKLLPKENIDGRNSKNLEGLVKTLQAKNLEYNRQYYTKVWRKNLRAVEYDEFDDPRELSDIQADNVSLKEHYMHQMMILEQYLTTAYLWYAEQQESNQLATMAEDPSEFNSRYEGQINEYGWVDYADNVNTIQQEVEEQKHKETFDQEAYNKSQLSTIESQKEQIKYQQPVIEKNKKVPNFVMPTKVSNLGKKIRNLFFLSEQGPKTIQDEIYYVDPQESTQAGSDHKANHNDSSSYQYRKTLQGEVDSLRKLLESDFKNQRIVDMENKIRNNKRIIVNYMTDNIFQLRFGFEGRQKVEKRIDRDELLMRMLQSRLKRIRIVNNLVVISVQRQYKLNVWGLHSDLIDYRRLVKVMQDIVILLQEKNLILEIQGRNKFTLVGEIERQLDWPIKIKSKYGPMDHKDYYSRKLRIEIDEHNALFHQIETEMKTHQQTSMEMKAFISAIFGNDGWIKQIDARWLRNRQRKQIAEYDPKDVVPLYVKSRIPDLLVPREIRDELPTHDGGQFGEIQSRSSTQKAQKATGLLHENLYLINRSRKLKLPSTKVPESLAQKALKGSKAVQIAKPSIEKKRYLDKIKLLQKQTKPSHTESVFSDAIDIVIDDKNDPYGLAGALIPKQKIDSKQRTNSNTFSNAGQIIDAGIFDKFDPMQSDKMHQTVQDEGLNNSFSSISKGGAPSEAGQKLTTDLMDLNVNEEDEIGQHMTAVVREKDAKKKALEKLIAEKDLADQEKIKEQSEIAKKTKFYKNRSRRASQEKLIEKKEIVQPTIIEESKEPKKSNWLDKIRQEQLTREANLAKEKRDRAERMKALLDSDSEDNEEQFDYKNMIGDKLTDFLHKIDDHVQAEQKILDAWNYNDEDEETRRQKAIQKLKDEANARKKAASLVKRRTSVRIYNPNINNSMVNSAHVLPQQSHR